MPCVARIRNLYYLFLRTDTLVLSVEKSNKAYNTVTWALGIHSGAAYLKDLESVIYTSHYLLFFKITRKMLARVSGAKNRYAGRPPLLS